MKLSVLIPCYNAEATLAEQFDALPIALIFINSSLSLFITTFHQSFRRCLFI